MSQDRREFLKKSFAMAGLASTLGVTQQSFSVAQTHTLGIPGPYPGRVVATHHPGSISGGQYQAEPVRQMVQRGMMELTGAPSPADAWRVFFEKGDVVGIKVNPVGQPYVISDALVLNEIISGLNMA
ncbi:MAG TPA: twin-arginine translocation signal domain-containing protein, partial [Acidobacteriota bacterium]|nr:twin-arginine translocation signal domain-containing protein [Acidobacteriota bacterium]